ncbi:MAG: hypothetical protein K6U74_07335 [Firmicutes bacterium]|nr:hypothetical protein [Bacillota bacterium]
MNFQKKSYSNDYRINILNNGSIISVEVTCCGKHIGEMRFKDGENKKCPFCGTVHSIMIQHNHFHIRPLKQEVNDADSHYHCKLAALDG